MSLKTKLWIDYYLGGLLQFLFKPLAILLGKILSRDHDLTKCSEVTYLKLLGGGSLVIAYPSLLAMRRNPNIKKLRIVCTAKTAPFAKALGVFDEILILSDSSATELMIDSLGVLRKLSGTDAIIDMEIHSRLSTIFCLLTRARNRIGVYTDSSFWRRSLATHLLFYNRRSSMFGLYDQMSHLFDSKIPDFADCVATFRAGIGESAIDVGAGYHIAVMPCCSDLSAERKLRGEDWPRVLGERLAALSNASRVTIHFLGGPGDGAEIAPLIDRVRAAFPGANFENHAGKLKLNESVALLGKMHEAICIDSALMHFARLMGTPTTTYWGPTDPQVYLRPHASVAERIHAAAISCSPCVHIANTAPCRGNNLCMKLAADPNCGVDANPIWLAEYRAEGKRMSNELPFPACPVCQTPSPALLYSKIRGTEFSVHCCASCGLQVLRPQPTWEQIKAIYDAGYYKSWGMEAGENSAVADMKKSTFGRRIREIRRFVPNGDLLDVGTASGFLLEVAQANGFSPYGVELSDYSAALAKKKFGDDRIHHGTLETAPFAEGKFSAITMCDLIEHVTDPVGTLRTAQRMLRSGGVILIMTPNAGSFYRRMMGAKWSHYKVEHLSYFSRKSMEKAAALADLEVVDFRRARKTLTLRYVRTQMKTYPHWLLSPVVSLAYYVGFFARDWSIPVSIGEFVAVLRKR